MVYKLTRDEVLKVCGACPEFVNEGEQCQNGEVPRAMKEVHRCKKWDEYFGSPCIFQG